MKFSIIIPTYNRLQYISEAVDSMLDQSYKNFEIIIVDDGSTDGTGELIERLYSAHPPVKYYYKRNEERGVARNYGLRKATGDYAVFFDSDDWMKPSYLQSLYDAIKEQTTAPLFVATKYIFRDETSGREWNSSMHAIRQGWYGIDMFLKGNMLACNFCIKTGNLSLKLFPTERELSSMEDWLFLLCNLGAQKIFIKDQVGVVMREHPGRSMANNRKIIVAREKATQWALNNIELDKRKRRIVKAFSAYFCGIHEYLDGNRYAALSQSLLAVRSGGLRPLFLVLFIKSIIGKKLIEYFKQYAG